MENNPVLAKKKKKSKSRKTETRLYLIVFALKKAFSHGFAELTFGSCYHAATRT